MFHGHACDCRAHASRRPQDHDVECPWREAYESEADERAKEARAEANEKYDDRGWEDPR